MAKIIVIIPNGHSQSDILHALEVFTALGFHNLVIIQESKVGDILVNFYASLTSQEMTVIDQPSASDIFPDKLKDLKGFVYKVVVHQQSPRVLIKNGTINTPLMYFMSAVTKVQNAKAKFIIVNNNQDIVNHFYTARCT